MTTSIFTDFEDRTMVRKGVDLEFLFQQDVDLMMLLAGCLKCGGAVVPERESVDLEWTERGAVDPSRVAGGRERLAVFKVPQRFVAVESLPRTASGKIQKFLLGGVLES